MEWCLENGKGISPQQSYDVSWWLGLWVFKLQFQKDMATLSAELMVSTYILSMFLLKLDDL